MRLTDDELRALDQRFAEALATGDESGLDVLGYGEISTVVSVHVEGGHAACKRLPLFDSRERFDAYASQFGVYLDRLRAAGITVVDSALQTVPQEGGTLAVYCVQPVLDADGMGPALLERATEGEALEVFAALFDRVMAAVDAGTGLDAQLSNWARIDGAYTYLDVTTPMLRDSEGRDQLDAAVFLASLPWLIRGSVRRLLLRDILDTYFQPRRVVLDFLGNLHKERLTEHLPAFLAHANARLDEPLTEDEVAAYYRSDARTWELLLRLRRADRFWQRRVRRRPYPFLLPGPIER